jgi:hypothetical protein
MTIFISLDKQVELAGAFFSIFGTGVLTVGGYSNSAVLLWERRGGGGAVGKGPVKISSVNRIRISQSIPAHDSAFVG